MKTKRMTTAEIAKKLHLSQPTVSRALNPARAWMVNNLTREKIRKFCQKSGVLDPAGPVRSKNFRAALVLGAVESDLYYNNRLIGSLTDQLQNYGCSLSIIRADTARNKQLCSVKRILKSDAADIFIINPCFLIDQNPDFLHQVSSHLVLSAPFMGLNEWIIGRKWLSGIYYDYEAPHRKLLRQLPDELMSDMVFFGSTCRQTALHLKMLRSMIQESRRKARIRNWLFDYDTELNIVPYRNARLAAARDFKEYAGHKLYWTAGSTEGLALYDEFSSRGLKFGRDYQLITYGNHKILPDRTEDQLPHFDLVGWERFRPLCELVLGQLEHMVPRQIPIPMAFYPGNTLPELKEICVTELSD